MTANVPVYMCLQRQVICKKEVRLPLHTSSGSYGLVKVLLYVSLTSIPDGNNLSDSCSSRLAPVEGILNYIVL